MFFLPGFNRFYVQILREIQKNAQIGDGLEKSLIKLRFSVNSDDGVGIPNP